MCMLQLNFEGAAETYCGLRILVAITNAYECFMLLGHNRCPWIWTPYLNTALLLLLVRDLLHSLERRWRFSHIRAIVFVR